MNSSKNVNKFQDKKFVALIATLCCLLWGSAYPSVKSGYILFNISAGDVASKLVFAGYRFILAGFMVLIVARFTGKSLFKISRKDAAGLLVLALTQTTLQYIFFYIGLSNTTGVKGSIMNATGTFFSVILAHYIYKNDRLNFHKLFGCIIGFLGVMLVNFSADLLNFSFSFNGEGLVTFAALIFSGAAIYGKKLSQTIDVMVVTGYSLFIGGLMLTLIGTAAGGRVEHFTIPSTLLLIYMAILSAAAFSLWTLLLKYNKVGPISMYSFLTPIFGAILSSIFLGENVFEIKNLVALALVCFGIWMVNKEKPYKNIELEL